MNDDSLFSAVAVTGGKVKYNASSEIVNSSENRLQNTKYFTHLTEANSILTLLKWCFHNHNINYFQMPTIH